MTMQLRSSAFDDGAAMPRRFTCEGGDVSPPLNWSDPPVAIRSFVVLCDDPDAPARTWHHWAVYDIPAERTGLLEDAARHRDKEGFMQALNDFGRPGYGGPCPPRSHGPHHYHFRLLALSTDHLRVRKNPPHREVEREARKHLLAEAVLVGLYER
jgi:Raf kinase inhibitor-like YbhB/YbcL family protein